MPYCVLPIIKTFANLDLLPKPPRLKTPTISLASNRCVLWEVTTSQKYVPTDVNVADGVTLKVILSAPNLLAPRAAATAPRILLEGLVTSTVTLPSSTRVVSNLTALPAAVRSQVRRLSGSRPSRLWAGWVVASLTMSPTGSGLPPIFSVVCALMHKMIH